MRLAARPTFLALTWLATGCSRRSRPAPQTSPGDVVVSIAITRGHACVATRSGNAYCWGNDNGGNLGDGRGQSSDVPVQVARLHDVVQVVTTEHQSCALRANGIISCWGPPILLPGEPEPPAETMLSPVDVQGIDGVRALAMDGDIGAVRSDGRLAEWGLTQTAAAFEATRQGLEVDAGGRPRSSYVVAGIENVVQIVFGGAHCARLADGTVWCWGVIDEGGITFGTGPQPGRRGHATPTAIPGIAGAVDVAVSGLNACAALRDGTVRCWGAAFSLADSAPAQAPWVVSGLTGIERVAVAERFACALDHAGMVWCWGVGEHGELGNGLFSRDVQPPRIVRGASPAASIGVWHDRACAGRTDGKLMCWGMDGFQARHGVPYEIGLHDYH